MLIVDNYGIHKSRETQRWMACSARFPTCLQCTPLWCIRASDNYIRRQASQDARRRVARVFVAAGEPSGQIAGCYTLGAASFQKDDLPTRLAKRLPHYPVPAAVIGRLAVDLRDQGRGFGETLLLDAIHRVVRAGDTIGVYAVVVDALHDRAGAFYERYGFAPFPSEPLRLFLPIRTFEQLGL